MSTITDDITPATKPRVYVGTYAKYNAGSLFGAWIDLTGHDRESFDTAARELHSDEEDPEIMLQDFEGLPRELYREQALLGDLWDWMALNYHERQMLALHWEATGTTGTIEAAQNAFVGTAESEAEFVEEMLHDTIEGIKDLPGWVVIDWQATWDRNLRHDYNTARDDDGNMWFFHSPSPWRIS